MPLKLLINIVDPTFEQNGLTRSLVIGSIYWNLYVYSCFLYMIAGLVKIYRKEQIYGFNLIVQSFLSYMSDVETLGQKSHWHLLDRYFALVLSCYHFSTVKTRNTFVLNFILFLIGLRFLKKSIKFYHEKNERFLLEHTKWHLIAPLMAII